MVAMSSRRPRSGVCLCRVVYLSAADNCRAPNTDNWLQVFLIIASC